MVRDNIYEKFMGLVCDPKHYISLDGNYRIHSPCFLSLDNSPAVEVFLIMGLL